MPINLRFNYLYRDSCNYKKFGHKHFSNPNHLSLEKAEQLIRAHLIDGEYFYPEKAGIPLFPFHRHCENQPWYQMESIETIKCTSPNQTIEEFISALQNR